MAIAFKAIAQEDPVHEMQGPTIDDNASFSLARPGRLSVTDDTLVVQLPVHTTRM
jgi:hypothetical protein